MIGFLGGLLGKVAGEAIVQGAEYGKEKLAENKAAKEARKAEIESMIGKKIKLGSYEITKWWNSNGEMSTTVSQQMKDRNWVIKSLENNNRVRLFHGPSQTTIFVLINDIL